MKRAFNKKLLLAFALCAVLAGATAAVVVAAQPAAGVKASRCAHNKRAHAHGASRRHGTLALAASYLGVSRIQLHSERHAGKTLAQIAAATPGKSEAGLIQTLLVARKSALAQRLKEGAINQAQVDGLPAKLPQRIVARVNRVPHHRSS